MVLTISYHMSELIFFLCIANTHIQNTFDALLDCTYKYRAKDMSKKEKPAGMILHKVHTGFMKLWLQFTFSDNLI